ncbi:SMC-Scp complex subunit ScpB [Candidatus Woesearchaeota archaeon]|nr:SMC-Scp complex subunit ScpB [Candidatus Woesearchaeota archaeon]
MPDKMSDLKKNVEAILFAAGRSVLMREFQSLLHIREEGLIKETITEIKADYEASNSPMMILSEGDGWKLTVREKYLPVVQRINPHTELSKTILETLSVIAWKHPVLQSDVIKVRTNKAYDHIAELERLGFVSKERHGRSFVLGVTQKFLDYFDLPDDKAIKEMFKGFKEIEVAVKKKAGEFEKAKAAQESGGMEAAPAEAEEAGRKESGKEDGGSELEPYIDVPPERPKPKSAAELEVYELPPEEISKDAEEPVKVNAKEEKTGPVKKNELKETPEEKAKRLARELLGEDMPKEHPVEEENGRKLHPKLEEFIAGSVERLAPKRTKQKRDVVVEKRDEEADEEAGQPEEPEQEEASEDDVSKKKPAEEFPGQFSDEGEPEKEDSDKEQ